METSRLILHHRTRAELENVLHQSQKVQMSYLGLEDAATLPTELERIEKTLHKRGIEWRMWGIIEKESQKVIGDAGFHNWVVEHDRSEVGYRLFETYRNKGYMTEAMQKIIKFGFQELKLNRIEACISPDNWPSRRLAEKLNFTQEGILREHYRTPEKIYDSVIYSILRSEFFGSTATKL